MTLELARQAAEVLILDDVRLSDHSAKILVPLSTLFDEMVTASQFKWGPRQVLVDQLREKGGTEDRLLSRRVTFVFVTGCRILRLPDDGKVPPSDNVPPDSVIAQLDAEFRLVYGVKDAVDPDQEALEAFARLNVRHQVWPWWREWLNSTTVRMGLPHVMLPITLHGKAPGDSTEKKADDSVAKS